MGVAQGQAVIATRRFCKCQNCYRFRAIQSWVAISADFQTRWISKVIGFEAKLTFLVFFWPRNLLILKTVQVRLKIYLRAISCQKTRICVKPPYGFRSTKKFVLEPVFRLSDSKSKSCFNLAINREAGTLVIGDHF